MDIYGNSSGIKSGQKQRLLHLYDGGGCSFFPQDEEVLLELASLTEELGREIGLFIDGKGKICAIFIGDHRSISIPGNIPGLPDRRDIGFLHTHPQSSGHLSSLDISASKQLEYRWISALGVKEGRPHSMGFYSSHGDDQEEKFYFWNELTTDQVQSELDDLFVQKTKVKKEVSFSDTAKKEKVLLVGLELPNSWPIEESLQELKELVKTAGGETVGQISQRRSEVERATFIGRGKLNEVLEAVQVMAIDTVVFDDELSGVQQRNLERILNCKVLDRTALILDIFAQRARSYEGKIQVELAQLKYLLTRLTGKGISMSRLGGGIGTRGPGETKLEVDRRRIHQRISQLEQQVKQIQNQRQVRREKRKGSDIPTAVLIGYTNAGKSTLLNYLTQADVLAEDMLFATLDPTIRKLEFNSGRRALLGDTVGFINKLPHNLIHAFKATLEEAKDADILIQMVDISDPDWLYKKEATEKVLKEIDLDEKDRIILYNKIDEINEEHDLGRELREGSTFGISARTGKNIGTFIDYLEGVLFKRWQKRRYFFSYEEGDMLHQLYSVGRVSGVRYEDEGIYVTAEIADNQEIRWGKWERK